MLKENPALAGELAAAKRQSRELARSPEAILDWFYRRTPYYDSRAGLYPVGIVDDASALEELRGALGAGR